MLMQDLILEYRSNEHLVIIHDHNQKRSVLTNIIEWFEGGDYFNFIKKVEGELKEHFHDVRVIGVDLQAAWYVCVPNNQ